MCNLKPKYLYFTLVLILIANVYSFAQSASFTTPDTVCVNSTLNTTNTSVGASTYYWNFCSGNSGISPIGTNLGNIGNSLNIPVFMDYGYYNGNYYAFVVNQLNTGLVRLNFGNSLQNIPTTTNLGNFGGIIPSTAEGIQIVQNNGDWVAIIVAGDPNSGDPSRIIKIDFGVSLTNNAPVATNWGNIGNLSYPHQLFMFQENSQWYGFTVSRSNNTITEFSFSNNFNNIPTAINLGNLGNLDLPTGIYPISENGNWYAIITNTGSNTITKLTFGTDLLNNPTGVNLGNPSNLLNLPRGIQMIKSCSGTNAYIANQNTNEIIKLSFQSLLNNTFTGLSLGNIGGLNAPISFLKLTPIGSDIFSFVTNAGNNSITAIKFPGCTNSSIASSTSQNPSSISYNSPGTYNISLTIDDGLPTQNAVCKQIVVVSPPTLSISNDTTICSGGKVQVNAGGANSFIWSPSTGLSNPNIANPIASPASTTKYYFTGSTAGCTSKDSINIIVNPNCHTGLIVSNDTTICFGQSAYLSAFDSSSLNYQWLPTTGLSNPSIANPVATPSVTTTYYVSSLVQEKNNLVVNGDFEQGNTGFASAYTYVTGYNSLWTAGVYTITTDPHNEHSLASSFGDHTSGSGQMMAMNGASTPINVWCQSIKVTPNTNYAFSAWFANWSSDAIDNLPEIQFAINGSLIGSLNNFPQGQGKWVQFYTIWNSGNNTNITICINDQQTAIGGNDFSIDDISFTKIDSLYDSIKVTVLPAPINKIDTIIGCGSISYKGIVYKTNTIVSETIKNYKGCDSIYYNHQLIVEGNNLITTIKSDLYGCKSVIYKGTSYTVSTSITDTIKGYLGCDSIIIQQPIVIYPAATIQKDSISNCTQVIYNGITYTANSIVSDTLKNLFGCDSIIHIHNIIVYPPPINKEDTISGCNTVIYKGITYTSNTSLNETLKNNFGCDSIILTHNIIVYSQNTSTTVAAPFIGCGSVNYKSHIYTVDTSFIDTIKNIHGCDSVYQTTNVTIHPFPTLSASDTTICFGTQASLSAISNGPIKWVGYNTNPIIVSPFNDTTYIVTASNNWACSDTISVTVSVQHFNISLEASSNPISKGNNLVLQSSSSIPYTIVSWSSNFQTTFSTPYADAQTVIADTTTLYKVVASSAIGCTDSTSITVVVIPSLDGLLSIPNTFSPNGDGKNEIWIIKGINNFPKARIYIYDRNGQIVYNDYKAPPFNGFYNGIPLPTGTYYYIIKLYDSRFPTPISGWLELLR